MPDWIRFVQANMGDLDVPPEREQEIVTELADHLEDAAVSEGSIEHQSVNWATLAQEIRIAEEEGNMYSRLRTIWIPGLITGMLAAILLKILVAAGIRPTIYWTSEMPLVFYIPWLITLPLVGAAGAFCSRRAGGNVGARVLAVLLPCYVLLVPFSLAAVAAALEGKSAGFIVLAMSQYVAVWTVVPSVALVIGTLPFLSTTQAQVKAAARAGA